MGSVRSRSPTTSVTTSRPLVLRVEEGGERRGVGGGADGARVLRDPLHLGVVAGEGAVALEELDRPLAHVVKLGLDGLGELVDAGEVDVADVAQRLQAALGAAELREPRDPAVGGRRRLRPGTADQ